MIGTTDTLFEGEPDSLSVEDAEVEALVAEVNQAFPEAKLNVAAIKYRYAGIRPLVDVDTEVYSASRRYEITDHHQGSLKGLVTATGGKYTTSRALAKKLADRILAHLGEPKIACRTATTRLPGAVGGAFGEYLRTSVESAGGLLPAKTLENLVKTYGARHEELLELVRREPELSQPICAEGSEILAQVAYAIEEEAACTMCDVMFRRLGICCLGDPGDEAFERVGMLMADRLGWSRERLTREIDVCREKIRGLPERLVL